MADIAFLLIIFFMVTTVFMNEPEVELDVASAPEVEALEESSVSVMMDADGALWIQGEPCAVEILEGAVSALIEGRDEKLVMLKIDKHLPHETFGPVLLALSRAEAEIALVGEKSEE
jgi:biopolymer transport protein ExbD